MSTRPKRLIEARAGLEKALDSVFGVGIHPSGKAALGALGTRLGKPGKDAQVNQLGRRGK
jgi:hypothetical protein